ncbi:MAG: LegC family aminotransferase [bacterium]|nr:LegC family aminotransferase [bacterium]
MNTTFETILAIIRSRYGNGQIPLHAPVFRGNEKKYTNLAIDSTFVSSVGEYVNLAEKMLADFTGAKYAVATGNGTSALHAALVVAGVKANDFVLTQPFTFVATANAIAYCHAEPIFIDIEKDTLGISPEKLKSFLESESHLNANGECVHTKSGRIISACLPMHSFGLVGRIQEIADICAASHIILVEDAAESIGSYVGNTHTGLIGKLGTLSFNGNKTITCGGGGAIITNDEAIAKKAKYITTTAKVPHAYEFFHDELGYNYRLPNLNAAMLCAQIEQLEGFLKNKQETAQYYHEQFTKNKIEFVKNIEGTTSNYWLNCILLKDRNERDAFLKYSNENGVMTRPAWTLMSKLPMYENCIKGNIDNALEMENRLVNIPSSVI